jgi:hypothetical protein
MIYPDPTNLQFAFRADLGTYADAAGSTPALANGTTVQMWADQSDNGAWLLTSTSYPVLLANQVNGRPCLRFDGATTLMTLENAILPPQRTMYALVRTSSTTQVGTLLSGGLGSLQWRLDGLQQRLVSASTADIGLASGAMSSNAWTQVNVSWDFTTGTFRRAGAADGTVTAGSPPAAVMPIQFAFGRIAPNSNNVPIDLYNGDCAFLAMWSGVHSTAMRQAVEAFVTSQFGV